MHVELNLYARIFFSGLIFLRFVTRPCKTRKLSPLPVKNTRYTVCSLIIGLLHERRARRSGSITPIFFFFQVNREIARNLSVFFLECGQQQLLFMH